MKKILIFLGLLFLLLFYIWQHSLCFKLTQETQALRKENEKLKEEFLRLRVEVEKLSSYNYIAEKEWVR